MGAGMIDYREQVESALRAVAVTSPTSYAWFGRRSRPLPRSVSSALAPDSAREILIDGLQSVLYRSFYTQGRPVPVGADGVPGQPDRAFVEALSRANSGTGGWQPGWRLVRLERATALVVRDGLPRSRPRPPRRTAPKRPPSQGDTRRLHGVLHRPRRHRAERRSRGHRGARVLQRWRRRSGVARRGMYAAAQRSRHPVRSQGRGRSRGILALRRSGPLSRQGGLRARA